MYSAQRAAQTLNVRLATLKVHLRVLGVSKWPSRKRSSIRKLLRHCPDLQGTPKQMLSHTYAPDLNSLPRISRAHPSIWWVRTVP